MRILTAIAAAFSISNSAFSLDETIVFKTITDNLVLGKTCERIRPGEDYWKVQTVDTEVHTSFWKREAYTLSYSKFGCGLGEKGSVAISPGRTESSIEFYETAIDLIDNGFSPVYVVDHVSQGFSPRLLEDNHKGHIYRFSDYVHAFADAVRHVENDLAQVENRRDSDEEPLFFLSNSMGGAIGVGYFQMMGDENPFKAAAMLGAMIRVNYLGFPTGDEDLPNGITNPTALQTAAYSEFGVIAQTRWFCKTLGCEAYATAGARETAEIYGSAFVEGRRDYIAAFTKAPEQVMTHSKARYDLRTYVWESDAVKEIYAREGITNPQLAAPTVQWTKQTAKFNGHMRREESIENMNTMPILMITGEKDVRAYTPARDGSTSLIEHIKFCNNVNQIKGQGTCRFNEIPKGFHELHKESDEYRVGVMNMVFSHFSD